jgi:carbamoyltransferase
MLRVARFHEEKRALVPAVVHVDGTGRFQTVTAAANERLYALIQRFYARTGVPMLLNTSFNVAGEPLVETPEDALFCLIYAGLDCCVLGDHVVHKKPGYRSILDLRVDVVAERIDVCRPIASGVSRGEAAEPHPLRGAPLGIAAEAEITVRRWLEPTGASFARILVRTPWGRAVQFVDLDVVEVLLLAEKDHEAAPPTGWTLLEKLSAQHGGQREGAIDEIALVRMLGQLRRARIITLRETG